MSKRALKRWQIEELLSEPEGEAESNAEADEGSDEEFEISSNDESETLVNISQGESVCSDERPFVTPADHKEEYFSYISKDKKHVWYDKPNRSLMGRNRAENVMNITPGPTRYAIARVTDIKSTFHLFMTREMQNVIIEMTNIEGSKVFGDAWKEINHTSLNAYFGLLLLAGVYRSCGEALECLWDDVKGRPIFKSTMSLRRFQSISRALRFDDKADRVDRRARDKLAPIRVLWDKWTQSLKKMYNSNECVTVDEQLVAFREKCPFKQYIPSKPAKYGIKIWALCDSTTNYAWSMQLYTGRDRNCAPEKNQGMRVVLNLTEGHNITCDNFFTTCDLAAELLKNKLTIVGTVRKNKTFLPPCILDIKKKPVFHSQFLYEHTKSITLGAYVPKKYRCVYLISTLHQDAKIHDNSSKKPDIIEYYNKTKAGVDTLDQLVGTYTCKRKTNRWPVALFANMLDISACNALIIWTAVNPEWNKKKHFRRRLFLEQLGLDLLESERVERTSQPHSSVAKALAQSQKENTTKKARCFFLRKSIK